MNKTKSSLHTIRTCRYVTVNSALHPSGSLNQVPASAGVKADCVIPHGMCFPVAVWWSLITNCYIQFAYLILLTSEWAIVWGLSPNQHVLISHFELSLLQTINCTTLISKLTIICVTMTSADRCALTVIVCGFRPFKSVLLKDHKIIINLS